MKRVFIIFIALFLASFKAAAAPAERIYVSTDRNVYLAGEDLWCSLFLVDCASRTLSSCSAVSYLELISVDGTVATAKIALVEGRGSGKFIIPSNIPSGNYRLVAYTASQEEESKPYGSRILSIFNTSSAARVKGGVTLVSEEEFRALPRPEQETEGPVEIGLPENLRHGNSVKLSLFNNGAFPASLSVSVHKKEATLIGPENDGPAAFMRYLPPTVDNGDGFPEYEGEIITAITRNAPEETMVTLSSAGIAPDVYLGRTGSDGRVRFFTNNIYGNRELVVEVYGVDNASLLFESPFTHPNPGIIAPLIISSAQKDDLLARKASLAILPRADTLLSFFPRRQDAFLGSTTPVHYHLDDYTRFDSFRELVVEILSELQLRENHGKKELFMVIPEGANSRKNLMDNILVLLDGVIISDLRILEEMDANRLDDVYIYTTGVTIGGLAFNGVVNFITKNQHVKAIRFPSNVIVTDYSGACYPVALLCGFSGDERLNLIYWNPLVDIKPGETVDISLGVPRASGQYEIVAEGFGNDGSPIRISRDFEIK